MNHNEDKINTVRINYIIAYDYIISNNIPR